jgi:hypothetical protein
MTGCHERRAGVGDFVSEQQREKSLCEILRCAEGDHTPGERPFHIATWCQLVGGAFLLLPLFFVI